MKQQIRVLLADDNELFREGRARILDSHPGVTIVYKCDNGTEVLDKVKENRPDLVLMKIRLPGYDGIDVTRRITNSSPASIERRSNFLPYAGPPVVFFHM